MELIELKNEIINKFKGDKEELNTILELIEEDSSIYPFNEYEYLICNLLKTDKFSFDDYIDIRMEYISRNPNLWIFEISSPRGFGEKFAQTYIQAKSNNIKKASKKLDKNYKGEYDLWYDGIKIEVKASRAVNSESNEPLYIKALSTNTTKKFNMNFQQLKPQYCDIFIWVAVFRDEIVTWIMNSNEVKNSPYYSMGQHRGNSGNEGQLHITNENIKEFDKFKLKIDIEKTIKESLKRK